MKRFYLAICLFSCLFLFGNLNAQENNNSNGVVIIKTADEDGNISVKKKRLDNTQSITDYLKSLDMDNIQDVDIIISSDEKETDKGENLIYIRSKNGQTIEVNGQGDWQDALEKTDFKLHEFKHDTHHEIHHDFHFKTDYKDNKVLLGVYPESGDNGVLIDGIVVGSGADKAGLKENDKMMSINGVQIITKSDLHNELTQFNPGDVVSIDVERNGEVIVISSTLTERNNHSQRKSFRDPCKVFYGVYVGSYGNGREGVGVSGIISGWPAEEAGLHSGDRILAIDGIPVGTHRELVTERDIHEPGEAFSITYKRDGEVYEVDARFKECPSDEKPVEETIEEVLPEIEQPVEFTSNELDLDEFTAYPNPTFGDLNVKFTGEAVPTLVRIVDTNGKVVYEENLRNFDGYFNRQMDISGGALGTMILSVSQNGKAVSKPVILITRA